MLITSFPEPTEPRGHSSEARGPAAAVAEVETTLAEPHRPEPVRADAKRPRADRFRDATRAVAELRRGAAVVVSDGDRAMVCAAAETVEADRLADLVAWSSGPTLLLRPDPAAGLAIGTTLTDRAVTPAALRRLADPTLTPRAVGPESDLGPGSAEPASAIAAAAIVLAKLAHLLPTLVAAEAGPADVARARAAGAIAAAAADIVALRAAGRRLVRVGEASVPLEDAAAARVVAFRNPESGVEHLAVVIGAPERADPAGPAPLVRLHSECFTGDVLGSLRCDCGPQLRAAIRRMAEEGSGVMLYLAQEGRGIGLLNKLRSYVLQDRGLDTVDANAALGWEADERDFSMAGAMLRDLGLTRVRLMTNNPDKLAGLAAGGLAVERASLLIAPNGVNDEYLATTATRFGHLLG